MRIFALIAKINHSAADISEVLRDISDCSISSYYSESPVWPKGYASQYLDVFNWFILTLSKSFAFVLMNSVNESVKVDGAGCPDSFAEGSRRTIGYLYDFIVSA